MLIMKSYQGRIKLRCHEKLGEDVVAKFTGDVGHVAAHKSVDIAPWAMITDTLPWAIAGLLVTG